MRVDEGAIEPVALDHDLQHAGKQRRVASRLHRQVQVAGTSRRCDPRVLDDDLRALLARLPDVVRGDGRTLGHVRSGHPDHVGPDHVGPRVRRAIDAERLLVRRAGADHAEPAVVVDERRLEAHARELAEQVRLLGRKAGAPEDADGARAMCLLDPCDLVGDTNDRLAVRHRAEARRRGRIAPKRRRQPVGMRALQVSLDALGAQHAAIERKVFPGLEADHLVVADLELNPALLSTEAAVCLDQSIRLDAGRQARARHHGQVRSEPFDDPKGIDRNFSHASLPCLSFVS